MLAAQPTEVPMTGVRRFVITAALIGMILPMSGCFSATLNQVGPLGLIMTIFTGNIPAKSGPQKKKKKKKRKLKNKADVAFTGTIGGLAGTFDVDVGGYGNLTGTAEIKGQKKAKLKVDGDEPVFSLVEAAILDRLGVEIDVTAARVKFAGSQTTGGVKKKYNVKINFNGTVLSGPDTGAPVKGTAKMKGSFKEN
jgi:hypothetical protein